MKQKVKCHRNVCHLMLLMWMGEETEDSDTFQVLS